jgi:3-hydroxyisobutyrate dehydrogenase-like beta-hydroxyacid dehydrogenase
LSAFSRIALIGFGEVGQILSEDLAKAGVTDIAVWDLALAITRSARPRAGRTPSPGPSW